MLIESWLLTIASRPRHLSLNLQSRRSWVVISSRVHRRNKHQIHRLESLVVQAQLRPERLCAIHMTLLHGWWQGLKRLCFLGQIWLDMQQIIVVKFLAWL